MTLFFIGVIEMFISTLWTRAVTSTKVLLSGAVTIINILMWYYVLQEIVQDIGNIRIVLLYAAGCSLGTIASTYIFSVDREKIKSALKITKHDK